MFGDVTNKDPNQMTASGNDLAWSFCVASSCLFVSLPMLTRPPVLQLATGLGSVFCCASRFPAYLPPVAVLAEVASLLERVLYMTGINQPAVQLSKLKDI